jgi:sugar lactone lactonase YvrE
MSRSRLTAVVGALAVTFVVVAVAAAKSFPDVIPLPNGWRPEGVEAGKGHTLYVGSVSTGAVRQVDVRSGKSFTLVQPISGRAATGIEYDKSSKRLFVAGAGTGQAFVYDARKGTPLTAYTLGTAPTFINDAALTKDAIYFTDSQKPQLLRVPVGKSLAPQSAVQAIPLSGDYVHQPGFNLNGIVATKDGDTLIAVQSNTASLLKIDPATGVADKIELTGGDAANGDGLLLEGRTLYVVQNQLNQVAVVRLAADLGSGTVVRTLTNPAFAVPTTIDRVNGRLYLPNARFGIPSPDTAEYQVVSLGKQ